MNNINRLYDPEDLPIEVLKSGIYRFRYHKSIHPLNFENKDGMLPNRGVTYYRYPSNPFWISSDRILDNIVTEEDELSVDEFISYFKMESEGLNYLDILDIYDILESYKTAQQKFVHLMLYL